MIKLKFVVTFDTRSKRQGDMRMNEDRKEKIAIVSLSESFFSKSLETKIRSIGYEVIQSGCDIREIEKERDSIELIILFLDEDMEEMTETIVYVKDMANDLDRRLILVGEQWQHDIAGKIIPDSLILERFKRPIVMDDLTKCISGYMEENTGEKRKKTILIVDDDITYMRTVYEWLKGTYHVGMASNGVQAFTYLGKNKADLVLLDYEMPIANGPQIMEMLKNDSETGHIPVMFLTSHGDRESVLSVAGLRPVDYLLKTIDAPTLLQKLSDFFSGNK